MGEFIKNFFSNFIGDSNNDIKHGGYTLAIVSRVPDRKPLNIIRVFHTRWVSACGSLPMTDLTRNRRFRRILDPGNLEADEEKRHGGSETVDTIQHAAVAGQ